MPNPMINEEDQELWFFHLDCGDAICGIGEDAYEIGATVNCGVHGLQVVERLETDEEVDARQ